MTEDERQYIRRVRVRSENFDKAAAAHVRKLARAGQSQTAAGFQPGWGAYGDRQGGAMIPGQFDIRAGVDPTPADVKRFIDSIGGNPAENELRRMATDSRTGGGGRQATRSLRKRVKNAESERQSQLDQFLADVKAKEAEANAANEARYERLVGEDGEFTKLRTDRQSLADNFGIAAEADIDQRLKETLGSITADQAARGLSNSTNTAANSMRAAKDTAQEQQRVRETRDFRKAAMLAEDTDRIGGVVERRTDVARGVEDFLPYILQYGRSNDGQGPSEELQQRSMEGNYQPAQQVPYVYGGGGGGPIYTDLFGTGGGQQSGGGSYPMAPVYDDSFEEPAGLNPGQLARRARQHAAKQDRINARRQAAAANHIISAPEIPGYEPPAYA